MVHCVGTPQPQLLSQTAAPRASAARSTGRSSPTPLIRTRDRPIPLVWENKMSASAGVGESRVVEADAPKPSIFWYRSFQLIVAALGTRRDSSSSTRSQGFLFDAVRARADLDERPRVQE